MESPEAARKGKLVAWGVSGVAMLLALAACLVPLIHRPQHHGDWRAAMWVIRSLRTAEETFRPKSGTPRRYADLDTLKAAGFCTLGEGEVEAESAYAFTSVAGTDTYTIVAIPPRSEMTTYSLVETGNIRP